MSNEIKEKEEYEKYARDHRKELDAQEVRLGDIVTVLVGHFAGEKGVIVGMIACDKSDYAGPYYEIEMECDVPEEFRVRKTLIGRSRVIGGVEKRYLKVIGNRAPKQPSMEIKQGDTVRVSKDAPKMYLRGFDHIFTGVESVVSEVEDDNAVIIFNTGHINSQITIPTKYLVKVDAEKKEAKYHKGDRVKFKNIYELQKVKDKSFRWMLVMFASKEATITAVEDNGFYRVDIDPSIGGINDDMIECKVEPTEHTEVEEDARIRQKEAELEAFRKSELDRVLHPEKSHTYEVTVDNVAMDWQRYEADLAKEVALKVANKYNGPKEAAEYAVLVAKAVVEGLKRK